MQKPVVLLYYIQVISVFITAMLFLKSSHVFLFIYLFFNESATQQSYIDRGHHHELAVIKVEEGRTRGPLLPLPSSILNPQSLS